MIERPSGLVGEIARWMDECAVVPQPSLSISAALAAFGAVLGRRWETDGGVRGVLHIVGVAAPGAGKESARQCCIELFKAIGMAHRIGSDGWASASGLRNELVTCPTRLWLPDELGRALQAYGHHGAGSHERQIVDELLRCWGAAGYTMLGKAYAEKEARKIEAPHGCLYGTTTPGALWRAMRGSDVVDGLFSRWIVTVCDGPIPAAVPAKRTCRDVPAELVTELRALARGNSEGDLARLDSPDVRPEATVIPLDDGAKAALAAISENVRSGKLGGDERVAALWSRGREQVMRVALCVAVGRGASAVGEADVRWAWSFVRCNLRALEVKVLVEVADTERERCMAAILRSLSVKEPRTRSHVTKMAWRFPKKLRDESLSELVDAGRVIHELGPSRTRSADLFRLSPDGGDK